MVRRERARYVLHGQREIEVAQRDILAAVHSKFINNRAANNLDLRSFSLKIGTNCSTCTNHDSISDQSQRHLESEQRQGRVMGQHVEVAPLRNGLV